SYERLFREHGAKAVLIITDEAPFIHTKKGKIFFHENTAGRRTKNPEHRDPLIRIIEPNPNDTILDCTLGLACDALVAASSLTDGCVVGLELNPLLEYLVRDGLCSYRFSSPALTAAARRIKTINTDHLDFLRRCKDDSYDIVYFDPMFISPVEASQSMQRIREIAETEPLSDDSVREACRVARRKVIIKGRRGCFAALKFNEILPAGNRVFYGALL
ncbi:MAG: class I SAM-dependent methyltransferase, partial [bacterium]